jgi:hypothetical protein
MSDRCYRHPMEKGTYFCQKDNIHMCEQCACCHNPRIYCQYRTACVIDLLTKEGDLAPCNEQTDAEKELPID